MIITESFPLFNFDQLSDADDSFPYSGKIIVKRKGYKIIEMLDINGVDVHELLIGKILTTHYSKSFIVLQTQMRFVDISPLVILDNVKLFDKCRTVSQFNAVMEFIKLEIWGILILKVNILILMETHVQQC